MLNGYPNLSELSAWLSWAGAVLLVVGLLMIFVGIEEFIEWRKGRDDSRK